MASCWDSTNFSRHSSSIRPPDQINALAMHFLYPKHQKFIPEFVRLLRILCILSTHKTNVIPSSHHPIILDRAPTLSSKVTLETLLFEESIEWRLGAVVVRTGTPFGSSSNFSFRHSSGDAYMRLLNVQNNAKTPLNLQKSDCARTEVWLVVSRSDLKIIQKYQKAGNAGEATVAMLEQGTGFSSKRFVLWKPATSRIIAKLAVMQPTWKKSPNWACYWCIWNFRSICGDLKESQSRTESKWAFHSFSLIHSTIRIHDYLQPLEIRMTSRIVQPGLRLFQLRGNGIGAGDELLLKLHKQLNVHLDLTWNTGTKKS